MEYAKNGMQCTCVPYAKTDLNIMVHCAFLNNGLLWFPKNGIRTYLLFAHTDVNQTHRVKNKVWPGRTIFPSHWTYKYILEKDSYQWRMY